MFLISKQFRFEASHRLVHHDGVCARPHGHSYRFELEVRGVPMIEGPKRNMVCDYADISAVGKEIASRFDHCDLNDALAEDSPTAEFLSRWIFEEAVKGIPDLWAVKVQETETTSCRYCPQEARLHQIGEAELDRVRAKVFAKVQVGATDECWPFLGSKDSHGYGWCAYKAAGTRKPHRLLMWLAGYDIEGMVVLHSCDNPSCCNPSHLRVGTHAENEADKDAKGRRPVGEEAGVAVLTDAQVREVWEDYRRTGDSKLMVLKWAPLLGVSFATIRNMLAGWSWNHITGLPKRYTGKSTEYRPGAAHQERQARGTGNQSRPAPSTAKEDARGQAMNEPGFSKIVNELLDILDDLDEFDRPRRKLPNCPKCDEDELGVIHADLVLCYRCGWKIEGKPGHETP